MCGIVGFTGRKNPKLLDKLLQTVSHRGRDERITVYPKGLNLGMNRFSIIDLSKNLYPMRYKHYWLIFNGEIYNYLTLKKQLGEKGVKFSSSCDGEVILPLYDLYGFGTFSKLEGMFAICIYDEKENKLILARDKSGEKPLYYFLNQQKFIFASELKTILKSVFGNWRINREALVDYLRHGSVANEDTLVDGVKKLLPSTYVVFNLRDKRLDGGVYWQPKIMHVDKNIDEEGLSNRLDKLIRKSVKMRLIADVPLGGFMSGGVDSGLIAYFASQEIKGFKTYSISFPDYSWYDESSYSKSLSNFLGTDHTEIACTDKSVREVMEDIAVYIDEPIVDPAALPTYLLAKESRKSVKVVVTGEGADELFGGYYRFHKQLLGLKLRKIFKYLPFIKRARDLWLPHRLNRVFEPFAEQYSPLNVWSYEELASLLKLKFKGKSIIEKFSREYADDPLLVMQLTDYRGYLAEQLLMKVDKLTMTHNLESRAPYLDTELINFALSLPPEYKLRRIHGKYLLRKVAQKYLPNKIAWRMKRGFSLPLGVWFREDYKDLVYESLKILGDYKNIFDLSYYDRIVKEHMQDEGLKGHRDKLWSMVVLAKWLRYYDIKE